MNNGFDYIYERLWLGEYIEEGRDLSEEEFTDVLTKGLSLAWAEGRAARYRPEINNPYGDDNND